MLQVGEPGWVLLAHWHTQSPRVRRMPSPPLVSVVMPFCDADRTLGEALESILSQTLVDFELVAIDDGSQDESAKIIQLQCGADKRVRLLRPGKLGIVGALNLGVLHSRASVVARMDADDIMHPERLEVQWRCLHERPELALVGTKVEMFPKEQIRPGYLEYIRWQNKLVEPWEIASNMYVETPFAHPSVMFRKEVVQALGGYKEGPFPEDYELWLRMHQRGQLMAKIPRTLLLWRDHPGRLSRVDPRCSREAFDRLRASYLARDPRLLEGRDVVIWGAGRRSRNRARLLMELGVRPVAWIDIDPEKLGKEIWGLKVYPPQWLDRRPKPLVLVYVRTRGARDQIREHLSSIGYGEGLDFLLVG
jgi:glycosyltransferase involved in cell wall biosynthesis